MCNSIHKVASKWHKTGGRRGRSNKDGVAGGTEVSTLPNWTEKETTRDQLLLLLLRAGAASKALCVAATCGRRSRGEDA